MAKVAAMGMDKTIWNLIECGDEEAYEKMYFYYYRRFYIYGQKITSRISLIEDAIQEVMLSIWNNREGLAHITFPAAYFYTSFRHLLLQKVKLEEMTLADQYIVDGQTDSPEQKMLSSEQESELSKRLTRATQSLTARQSEAIFLRFYEGLSYDEIAQIMGISVKAVYKVMARALKELRVNYLSPANWVILILLYYP